MTHASERLRPTGDQVNRAQRDYWDDAGARQYREFGDTNEALIAPFGQAMHDAARLQPGERVLDVGCGSGTSTLEAAERVAPSGRVVGVDISAAMLEPARRRVAATGSDLIDLLQADAQVHRFEVGSFDVVISRFGLMFFDDPVAALANLAGALRPGGRLCFVCPQDPLKSEWVAVALGAAVATLGRAPDLGAPSAAGAFAFADGDHLTRLLTAAGFKEVRLETITRPVCLGRTTDDTASFVMSLPESKSLFTGASTATVEGAFAAIRAAFAPYLGSHGVVADATAWLVSANR
jgi:SAM-dependent methyltransferase